MVKKKETEPSKEQKEVRKLLKKWNSIVDNPKKKKQADKLFDKIWLMKYGNTHSF